MSTRPNPPAVLPKPRLLQGSFVALALVGLASVACGDPAEVAMGDTDVIRDPADYTLPAGAVPCAGGAMCFFVDVPVDREEPEGETIEIRVAFLRAEGETPLGVLAVNFGGFGAPGVELLADWASTVVDLRENFHLLSWDPRGSGGSSPLTCSADFAAVMAAGGPVTTLAEAESHVEARRVFLQRCRASHGDMIDHMGFRAHAADLDAVREAIDVERLNYLGYSAGSALGQAYAEFYPERLHRVAWDSAMVPHGGARKSMSYQAPEGAVALEDFAAYCAATRDCGLRDPVATLEGVLAKAEAGALTTGDGTPLRWLEAAYGVVVPLYSPGTYPHLVKALQRAERGDGDDLAMLSTLYNGAPSGAISPGSLVYFLTNCAEELAPTSAQDYLDASREYSTFSALGPVYATDHAWCAALGTPVDALGRAVTAADVASTILVLQSTKDLATPLAAGEEVVRNVSGARLVVHEGAGHAPSTFNWCMADILDDYLVRGVVPEKGTACGEEP